MGFLNHQHYHDQAYYIHIGRHVFICFDQRRFVNSKMRKYSAWSEKAWSMEGQPTEYGPICRILFRLHTESAPDLIFIWPVKIWISWKKCGTLESLNLKSNHRKRHTKTVQWKHGSRTSAPKPSIRNHPETLLRQAITWLNSVSMWNCPSKSLTLDQVRRISRALDETLEIPVHFSITWKWKVWHQPCYIFDSSISKFQFLIP